jgi:ATP-dependent DNA helicase DinG
VSTETRSLQTQLLEKDIPLVERILGESARAELCLGASNFICKRKMASAVDKGELLLAGAQLEELISWEARTPTGIRAEFDGVLPEAVWKAVTRETDNCLGRKCHNFSESFYFVARERWKNARLLVANHALLASHMALDGKLLPDFSAVVIDEAHRFPGAVLDAMKSSVPLNELAGLIRQAGRSGESARRSLESFRAEVELRYATSSRLRGPMLPDAAEMLADQLAGLETSLRADLDEEGGAQGEAGLKAQMLLNRLGQARSVIESFAAGPEEDSVHWLTLDEHRIPSLHKSPLSAAAHIRNGLLAKTHTVVFTSATLSSSGTKPFAFFAGECGAESIEGKATRYFKVSSPFDYGENCLLFLPMRSLIQETKTAFLRTAHTGLTALWR